jgi:hypothetical protein
LILILSFELLPVLGTDKAGRSLLFIPTGSQSSLAFGLWFSLGQQAKLVLYFRVKVNFLTSLWFQFGFCYFGLSLLGLRLLLLLGLSPLAFHFLKLSVSPFLELVVFVLRLTSYCGL